MEEINIRYLAIISLGSSIRCKDIITEIYKEKELYFYKKYRDSKLKEDQLKEIYAATDLERINMLIGIFEDAYERSDFSNIDKIVKTFNPRIQKTLKNETIANVDEFIDREFIHNKYIKKVGTGLFFNEIVSEVEIISTGVVFLYMAVRNGLEITGYFINRLSYVCQVMEESTAKFGKIGRITDSHRKVIDQLKQKFKLEDDFVNRQTSLGNMLTNLIEYRTEEKLISRIGLEKLKQNGYSSEVYDSTRNGLFTESYFKYIGAINSLLPYFGVGGDYFFEKVPINSKIIDTILEACIRANINNRIEEEEIPALFITELMIYGLEQQYAELKHLYLNSEKDKYYDDLTNLIEENNKKKEELEAYEQKILSERSTIKKELENSQRLNKEKDETIRQLRKQLEKTSKENIDLEQTLLKQQKANEILKEVCSTKIEEKSSVTFEERLSTLNSKRIAIVGGNTNAFKQLKKYLPNITAYYSETADLSALNNLDAVFINHEWISHSLFYKVWNVKDKMNGSLYFISGTNAKQIISQMYNQII